MPNKVADHLVGKDLRLDVLTRHVLYQVFTLLLFARSSLIFQVHNLMPYPRVQLHLKLSHRLHLDLAEVGPLLLLQDLVVVRHVSQTHLRLVVLFAGVYQLLQSYQELISDKFLEFVGQLPLVDQIHVLEHF